VPEYAAAGEQRDRGNHQGDLQEDFSQIEAIGFAASKFGFLFQFAGLGVEFFLLVFVAIGLGPVFFLQRGGGLRTHVLVAVGADYNLLLITRIREESGSGIRSGIIRAVRSTGGVITSAGIIFAASMFGLLFGSVSTMVQTGFVVGMGLLIDTFVVRTVTVPAMAALVGKANWWPSKTTHATDATDAIDRVDTEVRSCGAEISVQAVTKGIQGDFSHRLATNNIRRSAARRRRTLTQHGKRVRRLSVAGTRH